MLCATLATAALLAAGCTPMPTRGTAGAAPAAAGSTLDAVEHSQVLRVCTPGDYRPFSHVTDAGKSYEGLDVDLVGSLAQSLGAQPQFVRTTWANLMPDFTAGRCDVAVGGISVTLARQKQAFFSAPYMVNGKTPLVRCADVDKYRTVAEINRPEVRVIANPGGSNERFARASFPQAQLTIAPDNLAIFDEVLQGRADVFVTESAEALVQQKRKPGLCAVNPTHPLQYGEMAWLLPRGDVVFKAYVDQWLHLARETGEYGQIAARWLP